MLPYSQRCARAAQYLNGVELSLPQILARFAEAETLPEMDEEVARFHSKFNHARPSRPTLPTRLTLEFRIDLIEEECRELVEALRDRDLGRIAAEAIDLLYVVLGTLVVCGLRARPFFSLVHAANMAKIPNPSGGKPLKPEGWVKPDCGALIQGPVNDLDPYDIPF